MQNEWMEKAKDAIATLARRAEAKDLKTRKRAVAMIVIGIVLLRFPILGVPLLAAGLWTLFA